MNLQDAVPILANTQVPENQREKILKIADLDGDGKLNVNVRNHFSDELFVNFFIGVCCGHDGFPCNNKGRTHS